MAHRSGQRQCRVESRRSRGHRWLRRFTLVLSDPSGRTEIATPMQALAQPASHPHRHSAQLKLRHIGRQTRGLVLQRSRGRGRLLDQRSVLLRH